MVILLVPPVQLRVLELELDLGRGRQDLAARKTLKLLGRRLILLRRKPLSERHIVGHHWIWAMIL